MVAAVAASQSVQQAQDLRPFNWSTVEKKTLESPRQKLQMWQEVRLAIMKVSELFGHVRRGSSVAWDDSLDTKNLLIACEYMA